MKPVMGHPPDGLVFEQSEKSQRRPMLALSCLANPATTSSLWGAAVVARCDFDANPRVLGGGPVSLGSSEIGRGARG